MKQLFAEFTQEEIVERLGLPKGAQVNGFSLGWCNKVVAIRFRCKDDEVERKVEEWTDAKEQAEFEAGKDWLREGRQWTPEEIEQIKESRSAAADMNRMAAVYSSEEFRQASDSATILESGARYFETEGHGHIAFPTYMGTCGSAEPTTPPKTIVINDPNNPERKR